jgi:hypothetical protein
VSALEELRAGAIGEEFLALLRRTFRAVAVGRGFPAPDGHSGWSAEAVEDVAGEFLASPQTPRRLTDLALRCRTDAALKLQMQAVVQNFFADVGRRTPVGRLVLRINEVLAMDEEFEKVGRYWAMSGSTDEPAAIDLDALVRAVAAVEIVVPAAWTGKRRGPDLDAVSVRRVGQACLKAAGGPVRAADMARAVARCLNLGASPLSIEASALDPAGSEREVGFELGFGERAGEVFALLNDHERIAIGLPEASASMLAPTLGVSRSKAALIRSRAIAILKEELRDEEDGQPVAELVFDLARRWAESWTN